MQINSRSFRLEMAKVLLSSLFCLFLIPTLGFLYIQQELAEKNAEIHVTIQKDLDSNLNLHAYDKHKTKAYFNEHPPSTICGNFQPEMAANRLVICPAFSALWQLYVAKQVAIWTIIGGFLTLGSLILLSIAARIFPRSQYLAFMLGWRLLFSVCILEVMVQSLLLAWLILWVSAQFIVAIPIIVLTLYAICIVAITGFMIYSIFKRSALSVWFEGEMLCEHTAPLLWQHVKHLAKSMQTAAPDTIIAGIDSNFFVTETPITVGEQNYTHRTLFISLPLLKYLSREEADALLTHELAHFQHSESVAGTNLQPKLLQYDEFCRHMLSKSITMPYYCLLRLHRLMFEFTNIRNMRIREHLADSRAAEFASSRILAEALIKATAYTAYRINLDRQLVEANFQHASMQGIAQYVTSGFTPYVNSVDFQNSIKSAKTPHPFDSHPPLAQRLESISYPLRTDSLTEIASRTAINSWYYDISAANEIEQRLWTAYEQRMFADRERSLAYRYVPANPDQALIVEKFFPLAGFDLKNGQNLEVKYSGLVLPGDTQLISWDAIANIKFKNRTLTVKLKKKQWMIFAKTRRIKANIDNQAELATVLKEYWQRHRIMRQWVPLVVWADE